MNLTISHIYMCVHGSLRKVATKAYMCVWHWKVYGLIQFLLKKTIKIDLSHYPMSMPVVPQNGLSFVVIFPTKALVLKIGKRTKT